MTALLVWLVLLGCQPQELVFPNPSELSEQPEPPPLLQAFMDGTEVGSARDWERRRAPELKALFEHYVYGVAAPDVRVTTRTLVEVSRPVGSLRLLEVSFAPQSAEPLVMALFLPSGPGPHPVLLGPNKCGLHSVADIPELPLPVGFVEESCAGGATEQGRGSRASYWSIDAALDAGIAVATWHQSDLDPDDASEAGAHDGIQAELAVDVPDEERWGAIAAWAWGNRRALDALEMQAEVDATRVAVFGHSRRGKTALWTAALDERVAAVVAHQSGTGGATLSRSDAGESVAAINLLFPHWFNDVFPAFADRESFLPVDQHMLLALAAPRPVLVTDGADDTWADPLGALHAVELASPAWQLYNVDGLVVSGQGAPTTDGRLAWSLRQGGHEVRLEDWQTWIAFLQRNGW